MRRVAEIVAVLAATAGFAASASASGIQTTGQPIRLLNPEATPPTFAANTPFHVRHGWTCLAEERATCLDPTTEFRLYVDGRR